MAIDGSGNVYNPFAPSYGATNSQGMPINSDTLNYQQQQLAIDKQRMDMQAQHDAAMRAQGLNPDGSPMALKWNSLLNPQGTLDDKYRLNIQGFDPNQGAGYAKYKNEALRTGPSTWASLQMQQQQQQAMLDKSAAAQQAMSANSQAQSGLAMRGGLSGGSRAALAMQGQRDLLNARQKVGQGLNAARAQTMTTDEANRVQQLGALASSEQDVGKYNKTLEATQADKNLQNLFGEIQGERSFRSNQYNEQMRAWAANKQAEATRNSGGGGK